MKKVQLKLFVKKATTIFSMASILFLCVQCDTNEVTLEEETLESVKAHYEPFRILIHPESEILETPGYNTSTDYRAFAAFIQREVDKIFNDHPNPLITEVVNDYFESTGWNFTVSPQEAYDWATEGLTHTPIINTTLTPNASGAISFEDQGSSRRERIYDYELLFSHYMANNWGGLDAEFVNQSHAFRYFLTAAILTQVGFCPESGTITDTNGESFYAKFHDVWNEPFYEEAHYVY